MHQPVSFNELGLFLARKKFFLVPHQEQPGTHDSLEASKAAHLLTPEWVPARSLAPCHPTATAPALDEALRGHGWQTDDCNE